MTQAVLTVSKVFGTAPMAVHFDATGTIDPTVSDTFRELQYQFDFGDPNSGTWEHSGQPKNTQYGAPLAAHVYDEPGNYTATLRVGDSVVQAQISVAHPDEVWAGANTICLSLNSDMTGAPAGASLLTNIVSWPTFESGKRYMLRAGQDFTGLGRIGTGQQSNMRLTSFGLGAKPRLALVDIQRVAKDTYQDNNQWVHNVDVIGLAPSELANGYTGRELLFYRNTVGANGIYFAHAFPQERASFPNTLSFPVNVFAIENESTTLGGRHTGEGQMIWMGNNFGNSNETNLRLWQSTKTVVQHNRFFGYSTRGGKANIKLPARGFNLHEAGVVYPASQGARTSKVSVADNIFNSPGSTNIWVTASVKPQDRVLGEGLEDIIMERNTHIAGAQSTTGGAFAGRRITTRLENFGAGVALPSVGHLQDSLPPEWQGPYFIDVPMPAAPSVTLPPVEPPVECPDGFELIDGECVEIPPIDPPVEPPVEPPVDDPLLDEMKDFYLHTKAFFEGQ